MKFTGICLNRHWLVSLLGSGAIALSLHAGEMTALQLAKEGNRYVGEQSKDKIVQLRSEKSVGTLTPNIWYVVFYDPTATLKAQEVKFMAGQMVSVKRPMRLLEPVTGGDVPLQRDKVKLDSNEAIKIALKDKMLENVKVTSTQLKLERLAEGVLGQSGTGQPVWKVKLWAAKIRNPNHTTDIGEIWLSAEDGKTLKNDLRIQKLD